MKRKTQALTPAEKARGWVEFHCPEHGFLVATEPRAIVVCGRREYGHYCGKQARAMKNGRVLSAGALTRLRKSYAKSLQTTGSEITKRDLRASEA